MYSSVRWQCWLIQLLLTRSPTSWVSFLPDPYLIQLARAGTPVTAVNTMTHTFFILLSLQSSSCKSLNDWGGCGGLKVFCIYCLPCSKKQTAHCSSHLEGRHHSIEHNSNRVIWGCKKENRFHDSGIRSLTSPVYTSKSKYWRYNLRSKSSVCLTVGSVPEGPTSACPSRSAGISVTPTWQQASLCGFNKQMQISRANTHLSTRTASTLYLPLFCLHFSNCNIYGRPWQKQKKRKYGSLKSHVWQLRNCLTIFYSSTQTHRETLMILLWCLMAL